MDFSNDQLVVCYMDTLPVELLVMALSHLSMQDLIRCDLVCRRFHKAIEGSLILQYHIALARVGAVDNANSTLSTSAKLERLETQELAWAYLNPSRRDIIPIPRRFGSFDLCGGVLVGARAPEASDLHNEEEGEEAASNEDDVSACELLGTTLPSVISGDSNVRSWSRNVGFPVYGLGIDTAQDLAIVIQSRASTDDPFQIHLVALSTFMAHPMAAQPVFQHSTNVPVSQISVRCMGNLVGVMFHSFETDVFQQTLLIFDWKTGVTKACIESVKEERSFDDFGFLAADTVVLPVRKPAPATLDVYKFDTRKVSRRSERLSRGSLPSAVRIASFWLPTMRDPLQVSVNPICCNAEPPLPHAQYTEPATSSSSASATPSYTATPSPSSSSRHPPFYLDGAASLLSFSFMVCHGHSAQSTTPIHERFTLVIQRQAFVRRVDDFLRNTNGRWVGSQWRTLNVPWTTWGPHISRWLTMRHLSWACFMSGSRLILSPIIPDDRSKCHLRILDFNPYVVTKERQKKAARQEQLERSTEYCEDSGHSERWNSRGAKGKERERPREAEDWDDDDDETAEVFRTAQSDAEQRVLVKLVDDSGVIPSGKLWVDPVHSQLPYRQVTTKESFDFANVVIDEERIGGILVNEAGDLTSVEILTM